MKLYEFFSVIRQPLFEGMVSIPRDDIEKATQLLINDDEFVRHIEDDFSHQYGSLEDYFEEHHDEENDNSEEIKQNYENEFDVYLKDETSNLIDEAQFEIGNNLKLKGQYCILYRELTAAPDWYKQDIMQRNLGIYWSWDKDSAEPHLGMFEPGYITFLIVGITDIKNVDWVTTLTMNANPYYRDEREIRLFDGSPIRIYRLFKKNKETNYIPVTDFDYRKFAYKA